MEAMMALSLASIGERLANKVLDTVGSVVSAATGSAKSFDSALSTASAQAAGPNAGKDVATLSKTRETLESALRKDTNVSEFTAGKSFHLVRSGDGYAVRKANGDLWKLPTGSPAEKTAKELFDCHVALENAKGVPVTGIRSEWLVAGESTPQSILHSL